MKTTTNIMGFLVLASMCLTTGCVKDGYNPNPEGPTLPSKDDYFDFNLRGTTKLSVNYDVPALSTIIEVYDQNPMQENSNRKKEGVKPIYAAYTIDGKYEGNMVIPTAVTEAYVYTESICVPKCVKLESNATGFSFDITKRSEDGLTRNTTTYPFPKLARGIVDINKFPYEVAVNGDGSGIRKDNLYSITAWQTKGWECVNMNYYTKLKTIGEADEAVAVVATRLQNFLNAQSKIDGNKSLLRDPEQINIKVPSTATDGMSITVTYAGEYASYFNTLGYYYYKDNGKTLTADEFYKIEKYVMIPNVDNDNMTAGETIKLLYIDENGTKFDKFPADYVIGWFIIANGFGDSPDGASVGGNINNGKIKVLPEGAYTSAGAYTQKRNTCMSDDKGVDRRFISLYDTKSKLRIFGIEDLQQSEADDHMDVMFFVKTSIDLGGGELPPVDPVDPNPKPGVWSESGTVAFEDIWPHGGDYDLNDVIVEYSREITFNKDNIVTKIKESYKPVQKIGSAGNDNFFACQYKAMGKITPAEGVILEPSTSSFVIEASAKVIAGNTYVIERDMAGLGIDQEVAQKDFNPYIIAKAYATEKRVEVHLPMHDMTSAADQSLMNKDNAYYISSSKVYPFAIDIPIANFIPADEKAKIDSEGQYPSFKIWAESKGTQAKKWYLQDKGKK